VRPSLVAVKGLVVNENNDQPLSDVVVKFTALSSPGFGAVGKTDSNGAFVLGTFVPDDGAAPGQYVVTFEPVKPKGGTKVPKMYTDAQSSPLKVEIPSWGSTELPPIKVSFEGLTN